MRQAEHCSNIKAV